MQVFDTKDLQGPVDWSGPTYTGFGEAAVKLRWITDSYQWHRNEGAEVFVVLGGEVDMHVRRQGAVATIHRLTTGQLMFIQDGEEHIACLRGKHAFSWWSAFSKGSERQSQCKGKLLVRGLCDREYSSPFRQLTPALTLYTEKGLAGS